LWESGDVTGDDGGAGELNELSKGARLVQSWYDDFGAALAGQGPIPEPAVATVSFDHVLSRAVDEDLRVSHSDGAATAVRLIWTKDYLAVTRRLEKSLIGAAHSAVRPVVVGPAVLTSSENTHSVE
jgi:hypothetical protein